jgi:hypothetical protein
VLDLDALVQGEALPAPRVADVRAWLREAFEGAALEERFDIARALGPSAVDLFALAATDASAGPVSVVCVTRMREAAVSCGAPTVAIEKAGVKVDSLTELDTRLQLCAEFLAGVAELARAEPDAPISALDATLVDRAVSTLSKQGMLVRLDQSVADVSDEAVNAEAVGLMSYFQITGEGTLPARPETVGIPVGAIEPMLTETRRARAAELEARAGEQRLRKPLGLAQLVLLGVAIVLAVAAGVAGAGIVALDLNTLSVVAGAVTLFTGVFVVVALVLVSWQLYPEMGRKFATAVSEGVPGMRQRLSTLVSDKERPVV